MLLIFKIILIALFTLTCGTTQYENKSQCSSFQSTSCIDSDLSNFDRATTLIYYVESAAQQEEDFIEMKLTINEKDSSLKKAIDKLARKLQLISKLCEETCKSNGGSGCQSRVVVKKFRVEPSYQMVRREPNFNGFVVTHEIRVTILQTETVGILVDGLLGLGIYQIHQLEWKPHQQIDATETAIDAGIAKGQQLCRHINRKMGTVLSIEEVFFNNEDQDDDENQKQSNDNDEEDEQQITHLQFKIECVGSNQEEKEEKPVGKTKKQKDGKYGGDKADKKKKKK